MSIRIQSIPGEYYHVYNRGVEKRIIFDNEHDYQRFLILMFLVNDMVPVDVKNEFRDHTLPEMLKRDRQALVRVHAFSLLKNHYHLLLSPLVEGGIAKFMQKLSTGYTMYFNTKNERTGSLFQGKYKIKHVDKGIYLKYMFEYIHLNCIRERFNDSSGSVTDQLLRKAEEFPWSSLLVYSGKKHGLLNSSVLDQALFWELFDTYGIHSDQLRAWKETDDFDEGRTFVKKGGC
jgi:putative transposase